MPLTDYVDMVCGSQMGKTDSFLCNVMGHTADEDPWPQMYIGPTRKNVESFSKDRFTAMINSTPSLDDGLRKGQSNKVVEKFIHGARIGFAWAGSATELASHPVYLAMLDERDRMDPILGEGSVDGLAEARVATYNGVVVRTSTPLLGDVEMEDHDDGRLCFFKVSQDDDEIQSPIWKHFQQGSRHHFAIPCYHCAEYFIPHSGLLVYNEDLTPQQIFYDTQVACPCCGSLNTNDTKEAQNTRGVYVAPGQTIEKTDWEAENPLYAVVSDQQVPYGDYLDVEGSEQHPSFWISGLCSPWRTYGHRSRGVASAKLSDDPNDEQVAINTGFGECYSPKGDVPDWRKLRDFTQPYSKGAMPQGPVALVAGVDVQKDSLYWTVDGYAAGFESWTIDYGQIYGETKDSAVWQELERLLDSNYDGLTIHCMLVDAGFNPSDGPADQSIIYQFCYEHPRAYAAKGYEYRTRAYSSSRINVSVQGKTVEDGLQMWHLDTDYFKSMLYTRLNWEQDRKGALHFPENVEDEYLKQITAETRLLKPNNHAEWKQVRRQNHWGDCKMMGLAAAHIIGAHRFKDGMEPAKLSPDAPTTRVQRGSTRTISRGLSR